MGGGTHRTQTPSAVAVLRASTKIQDGRGTFMRIKASKTGMYDMSIIDPTRGPFGWRRASTAALHNNTYIEGKTEHAAVRQWIHVALHRHADGPLSNHDNKHTSDWAKFTITIRGK